MKHCPACNFSFPDSRYVCDFDGTQLVADRARPPVAKPSRPSRIRRILESPMLLTTLGMLVLFLSAILIGHLNSADIPPVVKDEPARPSLAVAQGSDKDSRPPAIIKTRSRSQRARIRNSNTFAQSASVRLPRPATSGLARARQNNSVEDRGKKSEVAGQRAERRSSEEKQPKLIAIMKTTWNVLKKPFKF